MLKYSYHNHKLNQLAVSLGLRKNQVVGFDLPAGYTCKMANICKAFADKKTGKLRDGKNSLFRCYAASGEGYAPNSRFMHWHNYDTLRGLTTGNIFTEIFNSIPKNVKVVRIHSCGDYFSHDYFIAWVRIAITFKDVIFFGYTKHLDYVQYVQKMNLPNFKLVYSYGGKMDSQLTNEPTCHVITGVNEGLPVGMKFACVDNPADDFDCIMRGESFALALHGTQPKKKGL
jgi:hypothetical protein